MPEIAGQVEWVFELCDGGKWSWHSETETEARVELALLGIEVGRLLEKKEGVEV